MHVRSRVVPFWILAAAVAAFAAWRTAERGEWLGWAFVAATVALALAHQGESVEVTGPELRHRYAWVARDVDLRAVSDVWMTPRHRSLFPKLMLFDGRRATCLGPPERWPDEAWTGLSEALEPWLLGRDDCVVTPAAARALRWDLPLTDDPAWG
jgi:hypothetical protein